MQKNKDRFDSPVLVTASMSEYLKHLRELPGAERILGKIQAEFLRAESAMREAPEGIKRIRIIHKKLDEIIADDLKNNPEGKEISCKKGCAFCCNIQVMVSEDEGLLLYEEAKRLGVLDIEKLTEQAAWDVSDYPKNYSSGKSRCIFLGEDSACRIYKDRPMACRSYLVVSPPEECNPSTSKDVSVLAMLSTNIFESAALNLSKGHKERTLPEEILNNYLKEKST